MKAQNLSKIAEQGKRIAFPPGASLLDLFDLLQRDRIGTATLRRSFAHRCLDWTERHYHIGGAVGAALLSRFIEMKWLARMRDTRAVRLTHVEERGFEHIFGIRCAALRARPAIVPESRSIAAFE